MIEPKNVIYVYKLANWQIHNEAQRTNLSQMETLEMTI